MSIFSCAESNANYLEQKIFSQLLFSLQIWTNKKIGLQHNWGGHVHPSPPCGSTTGPVVVTL